MDILSGDLDRVFVLRSKLESLRQSRCPACDSPVVLKREHDGCAGWSCECGSHGFLAKIEGEWLVVDTGYEELLQADLEALKAVRRYAREHPTLPRAASLKRVLWQIQHDAEVLNRWVAEEEVA